MNKISLVGVPSSAGCRTETSQGLDQEKAPAAIREALQKITKNFNVTLPFEDKGDLAEISSVNDLLVKVEKFVAQSRAARCIPFLLGGAHTLSVGSLRALAKSEGELALVYIDAHPDLMPRPEIDYGSTIFHVLEEEVIRPENIYYFGIRQIEEEESSIIKSKKIYTAKMDDFYYQNITEMMDTVIKKIGSRPVLLSFDLDSIDPIFAPGVTTPYPLGLLPVQALTICRKICQETKIAAVELVELSPQFDIDNKTAKLAASLLIELSQTLAAKS